MPTTYRIAKDEGILYLENSGVLDLDSFIQSVIDVSGHPDFEPHFRVLSDLRGVEYKPDLRQAVDFGHFMGTVHALFHERLAAVFSDPIQYQFSKIVCLMARARGIQMQSFRDMDSAMAWLQERDESHE